MCSYVGHWENDSLKYESPCQRLIEIEENLFHIKTFDSWSKETSDTIISFDYEFRNQGIYYENDSLIFSHITKDSLVIKSNYQESKSLVYKRIPEIKSPTPKFEFNKL